MREHQPKTPPLHGPTQSVPASASPSMPSTSLSDFYKIMASHNIPGATLRIRQTFKGFIVTASRHGMKGEHTAKYYPTAEQGLCVVVGHILSGWTATRPDRRNRLIKEYNSL